jgi:hypothetical protein
MSQDARPKISTARSLSNPLDGRYGACYTAEVNARALALALMTLAVSALAAGDATIPPNYLDLPTGRYSIGVSGMLCTVCARAIVAEWSKIPELEKATVDFGKGEAIITIRLDSSMQVLLLRKGLRRAERLANMNGHYDLSRIRYLP